MRQVCVKSWVWELQNKKNIVYLIIPSIRVFLLNLRTCRYLSSPKYLASPKGPGPLSSCSVSDTSLFCTAAGLRGWWVTHTYHFWEELCKIQISYLQNGETNRIFTNWKEKRLDICAKVKHKYHYGKKPECISLGIWPNFCDWVHS